MSNDIKIDKSQTCERYDIRGSLHDVSWSIIVIDERCGLFFVQSDWGDFSYRWPHHGRESFKHFLTEVNSGYLIDKLSKGYKKFSKSETLKQFCRDIIERRRDGNLSKEEARRVWEYIKIREDDWESSEGLFHVMWEESYNPFAELLYTDPCEVPHISVYDSGLLFFVEKVFPVFQQVLKEEINETKS
jgi:hypothetical protein